LSVDRNSHFKMQRIGAADATGGPVLARPQKRLTPAVDDCYVKLSDDLLSVKIDFFVLAMSQVQQFKVGFHTPSPAPPRRNDD